MSYHVPVVFVPTEVSCREVLVWSLVNRVNTPIETIEVEMHHLGVHPGPACQAV